MNKATVVKQSSGFAVMCEEFVQGVFASADVAEAYATSINDAAICAFFEEVSA